jgi:hypothetical protein
MAQWKLLLRCATAVNCVFVFFTSDHEILKTIRAKYGLATTHTILTTLGDDQTIGSDIGCSFTATVSASSLGPAMKQHRLKFVVNAFHGYAHNRLCQLAFHPLYILGLGLEDLETCEHIFSSSNGVTILVWHGSYYHWLLFVDLHSNQWNDDKYAALCKYYTFQCVLSFLT